MTFTMSFQVRASDLDSSGLFSVRSAFSYYNEVAMRHDDKEGYSWQNNRDSGFSWVLYRWRSVFLKWPQEGERLTVRTWVSKIDRFMIYREFEVVDESREFVSQAVCICSAMDVSTRTLIRIPKRFIESYPRIERTNFISYDNLKDMDPIQSDQKMNFEIRHCDIDFNGHVNNLIYIDWIMDTIPKPLRNSIREFDIIYRNEIREESQILTNLNHKSSDHRVVVGKIMNREETKDFANFVLKLK